MKEYPLRLIAPSVRAILEDRKTQDIQIIKPQPTAFVGGTKMSREQCDKHLLRWTKGIPYKPTKKKPTKNNTVWEEENSERWEPIKDPHGQREVRLWVRETWASVCRSEDGQCYGDECLECGYDYRADNLYAKWAGGWPNDFSSDEVPENCKWKPSIHMPRAAARIILEVTDVRVKRLRDISEADAIAEGIEPIIGPDGNTYYGNYGNADIGVYLTPIESFRTLWQSIYGPESWNANPYVWVRSFVRVR